MLQKQIQKGEEKKPEADKCKLHPKIFRWPQVWTFPRIQTLKRKTTVPLTCEAIKHKTQ
jgi:hypothetical protein